MLASACRNRLVGPLVRHLSHSASLGPDQILPADSLVSWDFHTPVKLRTGATKQLNYTPISVPTCVRQAAERWPNHGGLYFKSGDEWTEVTFSEYLENVRTAAKAFLQLGLERFGGVCILGFNAPQYFYSDLGAIFAGGVSVGIYATSSPAICQHIINASKANIVVVDDEHQLNKILEIRHTIPTVRAIIQYMGTPKHEGVLSWNEVMKIGLDAGDGSLDTVLRTMAINQCCKLVFTSGTTGPPKAVMCSHDNMVWAARVASDYCNMDDTKERLISYLPLSHVASGSTDIYCCLLTGNKVYFASPDALKGSLLRTLLEVRPTFFFGVPRIWEKMKERILVAEESLSPAKKALLRWSRRQVYQRVINQSNETKKGPLGWKVADKLVISRIRSALGLDQCKYALTGASKPAVDLLTFFYSLNLPLFEVYGMSETCGCHHLGVPPAFQLGSIGRPNPGNTTKVINADETGEGEIVMNGRDVMMGYLGDEEQTLETISADGWLRSGDLGRMDERGFFYVTGRLKELIITAGGKNVAPIPLEERILRELPCVSHALVVGDQRKYLVALITLKTEMNLDTGEPLNALQPGCIRWLKEHTDLDVTSLSQILEDVTTVTAVIDEGIRRVNDAAESRVSEVKKWTLLPADFSIPGGELGPTMKTRRRAIIEKYADLIESLYVDGATDR